MLQKKNGRDTRTIDRSVAPQIAFLSHDYIYSVHRLFTHVSTVCCAPPGAALLYAMLNPSQQSTASRSIFDCPPKTPYFTEYCLRECGSRLRPRQQTAVFSYNTKPRRGRRVEILPTCHSARIFFTEGRWGEKKTKQAASAEKARSTGRGRVGLGQFRPPPPRPGHPDDNKRSNKTN